ncbi:MAG: hypothetical protein AAF950_11890 [Pseudomonadota bacterium]
MGGRAKHILLGAICAGLTSVAHASVLDNPAFDVQGLVIVWSAAADGTVPVVSDFVVETGAPGGTDLIANDAFTVVTGSLLTTQDSTGAFGGIPYVISDTASGDINTDSNGDGNITGDDAISAFELNPAIDTRVDAVSTRTSFYVASNTAFNITGELTDQNSDIVGINLSDFITLEMNVTVSDTDGGLTFGGDAQAPHSGGPTAGFTGPNPRILSTLDSGGATVFSGNQATASNPGTILTQSVRFDQVYSIGFTGYDLSFGTFDFDATVVYTVFVP